MQQPNTHLAISTDLCGAPVRLEQGSAQVEFTATAAMRADERGLVHGGFVFGLADYAAMLAINEPNVVLGSADVRLVAPVRVGDTLRADAKLLRVDGKKHIVEVQVSRAHAGGVQVVFSGSFVCFVPKQHVLEARARESV